MQIDTTGEGEPKFLREEGSFAIAAAARSSQSDGLAPSAWDGGGGSKVEGRPDGHGVRTEVGQKGGRKAATGEPKPKGEKITPQPSKTKIISYEANNRLLSIVLKNDGDLDELPDYLNTFTFHWNNNQGPKRQRIAIDWAIIPPPNAKMERMRIHECFNRGGIALAWRSPLLSLPLSLSLSPNPRGFFTCLSRLPLLAWPNGRSPRPTDWLAPYLRRGGNKYQRRFKA